MQEKIEAGKKYNFWIAVELVEQRASEIWLCKCQCGRLRRMSAEKLIMYKNKKMHSNGCGYCEDERYINRIQVSHEGKAIRIYSIWQAMRQRCFNPNAAHFNDYGGRGITVCSEWRNSFMSFYQYVSQLEHYGDGDRSLDRIDNNKGYFPGNVRWATAKEQANNTRRNKKVLNK